MKVEFLDNSSIPRGYLVLVNGFNPSKETRIAVVTNIIDGFVGLILAKRIPFVDMCPFFDVPLDDLNLRYP